MIWALLKKEFILVGRSLHGLLSMLVLSFTMLFLFHFSLERTALLDSKSLLGIKWAIVFLVSFVVIGQSTWEEREGGGGRVAATMIPRWILYVSKSLVVWMVLGIVEVFIILGMVLFFHNIFIEDLFRHLLFLLPGSLSLAFLGVSLSDFSSASRMKEIILPLLLVPFSIPIFLYGLKTEFRMDSHPESIFSSLLLMIFFCFFYGGLGALFQELQSEDMDG
jgi:heme exporter protein B